MNMDVSPFISSFISFSYVLWLTVYECYTSFVKPVPNYFTLFDAVVMDLFS